MRRRSARFRFNTSVPEGMNNRVIKRMAYGYRDNAYFSSRSKRRFRQSVIGLI